MNDRFGVCFFLDKWIRDWIVLFAGTILSFGKFNHKEINRLADIADLALLPFAKARKPLAAALKAKPPMELYWACTTASVIGEEARPLVPLVKKLLRHENLMVRMRAAEFLGSIRAADPMPTLLGVLNTERGRGREVRTIQEA